MRSGYPTWAGKGYGRGFCFTGKFSVSEKAALAVPSARADLSGVKTLIIDDNHVNRLILSEMLSVCGAVVTEANGGQEGVAEVLRAKHPGKGYALVLLDRHMPGIDGSLSPARFSEVSSKKLSSSGCSRIASATSSRAVAPPALPRT